MMDDNSLDRIRNSSLASMGRNEVWFKVLVVLSGIAEIAGLIALCYFMVWSDPTHRVIFAATMLIYATLGLWVWALATKNRVGEQRILRAIELLYERESEKSSSST